MEINRARELAPIYAETYDWRPPEGQTQARRIRMEIDYDRLKKRYGIALICMFVWAASMMVGCCLTGWIVHRNTEKAVHELYSADMAELAELRQEKEYQERANFLSAQQIGVEEIQNNAIELSKDNGMWKTEAAFKTYCWNVVIRKNSQFYPNSIIDVLSQPAQYEYYDHNATTYNSEKVEWATEVLEQAKTGKLPAYLTLNHVMLTVRDGGNDCVLNTEKGDDPWRWKG